MSLRKANSTLSGTRAIVTDAETRLGLYVIRSLGKAGCRVTALSAAKGSKPIGFSSRYASECHRLPEGDYLDVLPDAIERLAPSHDLLMPVATYSLMLVGRVADRLEPLIPFYIPPRADLHVASDKGAVTRIAREAGVPVPETFEDLDPETIDGWAEEMAGRYPLVVKFKDDKRSGGWDPADRYSIVRSPAELVAEYRRMHSVGEFPLVQECIEGDGYGFFTIMDPDSEPVATFCHKRLREYPISGGPSTLCESFHDDRLVELGTKLLKAMSWRGVAMVEFKQDRRSGEYKLLEINPRFWGSLPLALQCGVDFPVYQAQLALGREPRPGGSYPVGRKMRFFFSDLLAVRDQWRAGNKGRVAATYLKELLDLRIRDGLFELGDPRPAATYVTRNLKSR